MLSGLRFDVETFTDELIEMASPKYGRINQVNLDDGDVCFFDGDGYFCEDFDHLVAGHDLPRCERHDAAV